MNLKPELVSSLEKVGFVSATEVQKLAIPEALQNKNVIARAKTGTGKTAAFIIPILQNIVNTREISAVIIVPTRELALQVSNFAQKVGNPLRIHTVTVYGGASINVQIQDLRSGANIIVGTPGRVIDLIERRALKIDRIKFLVLDEADIMLDMGFIDDVEYIISKTPKEKQVMLFSATMPKEINKFEKYFIGPISKIMVGKDEEIVVNTIKHSYTIVPRNLKYSGLLAYIKEYSPKKAIIFARTKFEADSIHKILISQKYYAIIMHGGLTQAARERALESFKRGAQFLIATNIAARGLQIEGITDIINFGVPDDVKVYVHRVGRSARMGKEGRAFTIADQEQRNLIMDIEDYGNLRMTRITLDLEPFRNIQFPSSRMRDDNGRRGFGRSREHGSSSYGRSRGSGHSSYGKDRKHGSSSYGKDREHGSSSHKRNFNSY
jgi:ATP-dependent RNA helicase DeaD